MWNLISSPRHPSLKQLIDSLRMFLLKQEAVARIAIAGTPLALPKKITRKAMTEKKMTTGMSAKTMKSIKKFLKLYKIDILPTMKKLSPFFYCDVDISPKAIEVGAEMLCTEKIGVKLSKVTYLKMKNVKQEVTKMVKYHASKKRLLMGGHFSENIWVKLGVASDGKSTKVILQIVNVKKSNKLLPKLVGVFNAADTYLNLKTLFSPNLRVQTEKLAASGICIGKQGLGFPKNVPVKMFSVCEYDSMCNLVGHEGRSSSHPCLWCLVPQKGLRDMKGHPHTPFLLDKNKLKRYSHCAYKQRSFDLESRSEANGMVDDPIIDIPRDQLVPCPRRILTRLGLLFFNLLFQKCKKLDHISRFKDCKKCYELVEFETEVQSCTSKLLAAVHDQSISNDVVSLITKQNNKAVEGEAVNRCDFLKCTEEGQIKTTKLECQSCCKWFHKSCVSVIQDYKNLNNRPYTCPVCEKTVLDLPHLLTLVLQKKSEENTKVDSLKEKLQVAEVNRTMVASKHAVVGTLEQKLSNIVTEELKIPMSTFLSKELTWDGLKKIMSSYEKLVSVLYLHHDLKSTFMKLFEEFAAIHKILGLTRFLSDSEIDSLSRACWRLGSWYPLKFKQSVTLEFHILVFHVPEFLKQWHGIGMFADSEKVAVHESFQNDLRSSASTSTSEQLKFSYAKNLVKSLIPVRKRKANTSESGPPAKKVNSEHSVVSDNSGTSEQVSKSPQDSQKKPQAKEVASTFIVSTANAST
uniref:Uncharacterized protein LOC102806846 n=1 Tax=Saccoglossus kowalevskii TaxID=10224 RepID=A0ABM0M0K2_SACKO|nr:PREDICTED: uncharacterized protein LOC102806846 [Saccoglossus kowalevskii]